MAARKVSDIKKEIDRYNLVTTSGLKKAELYELLRKVKQYKIKSEEDNYVEFNFGEQKIKLNDQQQDIVKAPLDQNCRIIACAGSGKTTTIVCRIKYLLDNGVDPSKIMLTTFNVDAAESLRNRLIDVFGFLPKIFMGTIDSIAYRFYNMYFKREDFVGVSEYCTEMLAYLQSDEGEKIKGRFQYVFFDEFQDCNETQFEIIQELYDGGSIVTVIGDDAQNIYQWRGSNIDFILNFYKYIKRSKTYTLSKNFRSTPEIINFANKSIELNKDQIPKDMIPNRTSIEVKPTIRKYMNEDEQSESILAMMLSYIKLGIPKEEIAIISRNNYSIKNMEEVIERYNYRNKDDPVKYVALIADDKRDTKPKIMKNHVTLTTVHKAKGLEWDVVFFVSCNDDKFPSETDEIAMQEERRLFYVGITRAKRYLNISFTGKTITRFVGELDKKLYDFPNIKNSYFKYNNNRALKFKTGVTSLVEMLESSDIKEMREEGLLPEINPCTQNVHSAHKFDPYIERYYLQADYGIYIDRYLSRSFGVMNPLSGGLLDITANKVLFSLSINGEQYSLYMKYNANIISRVDRYKEKKLKKIIKKIDKRDDDPVFIKKIDESDKKGLKKLLKQMIKMGNKLEIEPSEVFVVPIAYIPYNFHDSMIKSYKKFKDRKEEDINEDIYQVSLCGMIYDGRRRLLYKNVFEEFNRNEGIYADMDDWVYKFKHNNVTVKKHINDTKLSIVGEMDLYDKSNECIVDFKASLNSECKLEWVIQLLMYASLMKKKEKVNIKTIAIYNPIMGSSTDIDISKYSKHNELLKYMDSIRATRLSRTKKISMNKK
jgi:hypothetical protein